MDHIGNRPIPAGYFYDEERAKKVLEWFPRYLCHTKGEWYGKPFELLWWQRAVIAPLFGVVNAAGDRLYRKVFVAIPKKNGKTELGAGVALRILLADGQMKPEVYSVASDKEQASICFECSLTMVKESKALTGKTKPIASQKRMRALANGGLYRVLSSDVSGKQGYSPSCVVFDELHEQPNRELWDALTSEQATMARRSPVIFAMTTAGYDRNSICHEVWQQAKDVLEGKRDDPTMLPVIWETPEDADWKEPSVWQGCNPSWNVTIKPEVVERTFRSAIESSSEEANFRRWTLNQWTEHIENLWLNMDSFDRCAQPADFGELKNVYGGLDLGLVHDLSAMAIIGEDANRILHVELVIWMAEETVHLRSKRDGVPYRDWADQELVRVTPGVVTDLDQVEEDILSIHHMRPFTSFGYDPRSAAKLAMNLEAANMEVVAVPQSGASLNEACRDLTERIGNKRLRHGGHPVLRWSAKHVVAHADAAGYIRPDKERSRERIDPISALVTGLDRLLRQPEEPPPAPLRNRRSKRPVGAGIMDRRW